MINHVRAWLNVHTNCFVVLEFSKICLFFVFCGAYMGSTNQLTMWNFVIFEYEEIRKPPWCDGMFNPDSACVYLNYTCRVFANFLDVVMFYFLNIKVSTQVTLPSDPIPALPEKTKTSSWS